ncbi:type IV pilus biogenesis protein PilP [Acidovorax sp. LjRoot118]|uniref:type IV pilus biogenesis protein PilP n=1 Tax=Acidovorax sp. LjRoot118 TaxID=3342256 RepID=UPI003F50656F
MAKYNGLLRNAAAIALACCAGMSIAQTVVDRTAEMQAQIQLLDQQAMLNQALQRAADPLLSNLPRVLAISGMEGDLRARLILANGTVTSYREGDVVRGSMTVAAITPRTVMVKVGKKKSSVLALEFVAGATTGGGAGPAPGMAGPGVRPGQPMPVPVELLPPPPRVSLGGAAPAPMTGPAGAPAGAATPAPAGGAAPTAPVAAPAR